MDNLVKYQTRHMPGCVVIKHSDNVTVGIPDLSTTWGGLTAWQECKFGDDYEVSDAQLVMMSRLARAGMAYYPIFLPDRTIVCSGLNSTTILAEFEDRWAAEQVALFIKQEILSAYREQRRRVRS